MTLLIAGLLLWSGAHFFKRLAPATRASLGDPGKGLVAVALVVSIVLMVLGWRAAPSDVWWTPPSALTHLNNAMMLLVFYLFGVGAAKGTTAGWLRHPQLTAVVLWATAHLLVNAEVKALVLFGGLLAWSLGEMVVINQSQTWDRPAAVSLAGDAKALVIGVVVMALVIGIHGWVGPWPLGG